MSVKKRKQAKALQDLGAKLPLTNLAGVALVLFCGNQGLQFGEGMMSFVFALVGAVAGLILYGAFQARLQKAENRWKAKIREMGQKMEAKLDEEQGAAKLLDAFELEYLGGHPGWPLRGKAEFGALEVFEKVLIFKNRNNRAKFNLARIRKVVLETEKAVRLRKSPDVLTPKPRTFKNALVQRLWAFLLSKQRLVTIDYLDDLGENHLVVLSPVYGNPQVAKAVKEAIDAALKKIPRDKRVSTSPTKTGSLQQASDAAIAAAEAASRAMTGANRTVEPALHSTPIEDTVRYQVLIDHAGDTSEARAEVAVQMAAFFKIPPEKAVAALSRLPFVARRNVTLDQANRLAEALQGVGAVTRVETMDPATVS